MEEVLRRKSKSDALIKRPTLAVQLKDKSVGSVTAPGAELARPQSLSTSEASPPTREARIRAAAYARYERRGCAHGHALDDWLAAEAELRD